MDIGINNKNTKNIFDVNHEKVLTHSNLRGYAMQKDKKGNHPSEYLNNLEEWSEHQYNPGHWVGGNIPPHIKYAGRHIGFVFLISGLLSAVGTFESIRSSVDNIFGGIITGAISIVLISAGIVIIRKKDEVKKNKKKKRGNR